MISRATGTLCYRFTSVHHLGTSSASITYRRRTSLFIFSWMWFVLEYIETNDCIIHCSMCWWGYGFIKSYWKTNWSSSDWTRNSMNEWNISFQRCKSGASNGSDRSSRSIRWPNPGLHGQPRCSWIRWLQSLTIFLIFSSCSGLNRDWIELREISVIFKMWFDFQLITPFRYITTIAVTGYTVRTLSSKGILKPMPTFSEFKRRIKSKFNSLKGKWAHVLRIAFEYFHMCYFRRTSQRGICPNSIELVFFLKDMYS